MTSSDDHPDPLFEALAVNPTGTRLVAIGVIEYANALWRPQLLMVDTTGTGAVADWYTDAYDNNCYDAFATYLRDVDFSPAGDYFVVVTTGRLTGPNQMCDTAARRPEAAERDLAEMLRKYPGTPQMHFVAGTILLANDSDKALEEWKAVKV